ncbi:MAG: hypothetical protein WBF21_03220 [Steroidobacteraceae bacterium]
MKARDTALRAAGVVGALIGYGCLIAFLSLVGLQSYRWFRDGEWTHFGMNDGLRIGLTKCCVKDGDTGRLAAFMHWLDAPVNWLGMHKVFEVVPASLALFAISMAGNCLFIYCRDRLARRP